MNIPSIKLSKRIWAFRHFGIWHIFGVYSLLKYIDALVLSGSIDILANKNGRCTIMASFVLLLLLEKFNTVTIEE